MSRGAGFVLPSTRPPAVEGGRAPDGGGAGGEVRLADLFTTARGQAAPDEMTGGAAKACSYSVHL